MNTDKKKKTILLFYFAIAFFSLLNLVHAADTPANLLDTLSFGDPTSESAHHLTTTQSQIQTGAFNQSTRKLLPLNPQTEFGGSVSFAIKCDPIKPNYFTIKLWGSDAGEDRGRLLLFINGKQLGVRHLGDYDDLDILSDMPRFPNRFFYKTLPLPPELSKGKTSINLEIRSLGRIWGYGTTWQQFQRPMEKPSRGIYKAYTHLDPFFIPTTAEVQGEFNSAPPTRQKPGTEALDALKQRVNNQLSTFLSSSKPLGQIEMQLLAKSYNVSWSPAFHNPLAVRRLVDSLDTIYLRYAQDHHLAASDPDTSNPDWFGLGMTGDVIRLLAEQLQPSLDKPVTGGNGISRRAAWAKMLIDCRDWHRRHRRLYSNQTMINDLYGIYLPNRALQILQPQSALPENKILHYLYQSVGLEPWLGSDTDTGSEQPVGDHYFELTDKGLTKELGYVGAYGEVLDWMASLYDATRPALGQEGDPKIKAQLIKIAKARAVFRYPLIDDRNNRAMVLETIVGWRDSHYPGDITYGQRTTWDAGPLETAAVTRDPALIGYAQQMLDDNQFFAAVDERMKVKSLRVTAGLLDTPEQYETIRSQPPSFTRLPAAAGQPDFAFADEEDGVVALKNGSDILYASLYWRARFAINHLARIHLITPQIERDTTLFQDCKFDDSGLTYTTDSRIVESQVRRMDKYAGNIEQALEGEVLPIAKIPPGVKFKPGQESVYAGKASFYNCRFGHYLIAMNTTTDQTFSLPPPDNATSAVELISKKTVEFNSSIPVPPRSTLILCLK